MGGRGTLGLAVLVCCAVLAAGCTRRTDGYCCSDATLCADVGGLEMDCPSGQLCDDNGAAGPKHTCVADPDVIVCRDNPTVCDGTSTPVCVDGICVECDDDLDCSDPLAPSCDLGLHRCGDCASSDQCERFDPRLTCAPNGACVECDPADPPVQDPSCPDATAPVCGADGGCRGCLDHRECASGACDLATGACAEEGDIAYVDRTAAAGNTACTSGAMCNTIAKGLAVDRPFVLIAPGSYMEDVVIDDRYVALVGYGATLTALTNGADGLAVGGLDGHVGVFGMNIGNSQRGVSCDGSQLTATVRVTLVDVVVEGNDAAGIDATNCDLTMVRSRATANNIGGLYVHGAGFDITNCVFDDNGITGLFGGVRIDEPRATPQRLAFNTIVGNRSGSTGFPGVNCSASATVTAFHSNIITANTGNGGDAQVSAANCSYRDSLIDPAQSGDGNITGDPMLDGTFHIASGSPARGAAQTGSGVADDFDGEPRDSAPDIGADEFLP